MNMTTDQYQGLHKLIRWYRKYQQQFIEISGTIGTGTWDLVQMFIDHMNLDGREVMYLSYNQKQVLELAYRQFHSYYINGIIYNYLRIVDFDTLPVINPDTKGVEFEWKKEVRKKIDEKYKLIVVFDSLLLNYNIIKDLSSFGIPVILIRDPMLLPAPDTHTFLRNANINLEEPCPEYLRNPLVYFAHKILNGERMKHGTYDTVSIVPRKQMNLYNLKSTDMNITVSDHLKDELNQIYRARILKRDDQITVPNERVMITESIYNRKITNPDNKKVKLYLTRGTVGFLSRVNKHQPGTKYVGVDFRPEFYHEAFTDLALDRHYLNRLELSSRAETPDEILKVEYAYALTAAETRLSHWDKVTLIVDPNEEAEVELQQRLLYTAITRAKKLLTIIL